MITATCVGRIASSSIEFCPYDGGEVPAKLSFQLACRRWIGSRFTVTYVSCVIFGRLAQKLERVVNDAKGETAAVSGELDLRQRARALDLVATSIEIIRPPQPTQKMVFTLSPSQD